MATLLAGTKTTTSLKALQFQRGGLLPADVATIANAIKQYNVNTTPNVPGAFENGTLYLPNNKGSIRLSEGDWIMVDGAGFPLIIPGAIFATSWQHN